MDSLWKRTETPIKNKSKSDQLSTFVFRTAWEKPISFQSKSELRGRVSSRLERRHLEKLLCAERPKFLRRRIPLLLETWDFRFDCTSKTSHHFNILLRLFVCLSFRCESLRCIVRGALWRALWFSSFVYSSHVSSIRSELFDLRTVMQESNRGDIGVA
jgi:hypothetical protein